MAAAGPLLARSGSSSVEQSQTSRCAQMMTGLQGLISQMENEAMRKLWKVCEAAKTYEDAAEKSMSAMTHVYCSNRRLIVSRYMSELKFVEQAEGLARNLTLLRKRTTSLAQKMEDLSSSIQTQMEDMHRAEVDVDMKLRACRGSCRSTLPFAVDHPGYEALQADMTRMRSGGAPPPADTPHIRLRPVDAEAVPPGAGYKSIPAVQRELLTQFEDIGQNQLTVEEAADVE